MSSQPWRPFHKIGDYLAPILCCLVLVLTWSTVLINRVNEHRDLIDGATNETMNLASAISGYLEQTLGSLDQMLVAARLTSITPMSRPILKQMAEVSHLDGAILSLSLFDATGALIATTAPGNPTVNVADRSWFKEFRDRADDRLFVGPPIFSRTVNRASVILARGIRDDLGHFQGMVGMSISPEFFADFFRQMPMGRQGVINLVGRNGMIYVRVGSDGVSYGQPVTTPGLATMLKEVEATSSGTRYVNADRAIDHIAKYFSYQALPTYPLIINVGVAEDDVLGPYWSETWNILAVTVLFSVALIVATIIGQRRMNIILDQGDNLHLHAQSLQVRNKELAEQSLALSEAIRLAQVADRLKGEFIANMSHELRTPLNAIIGFSSALLDGPDETGNPSRRANLGRINAAGHHLLDLVTGVLEMAKLESGTLDVTSEVIELGQVVTECIEMTMAQRETKGIELTFDPPPTCLATCDPIRTRQIALNILSNAIKFSPEGSRLTVKVSDGGPDPAVVEIADNGIGMTEDEIGIALTPFAQVSSGVGKCYDGTGLGLPLAKRLVEVQGGKLIIESVKGSGTTVRFDLPGASAGCYGAITNTAE